MGMCIEHGISISYDMVLEISAQLGDTTVSKYVEDGVVCAPVLRKGLFTTSAMDKIDHNPTAARTRGETQGDREMQNSLKQAKLPERK